MLRFIARRILMAIPTLLIMAVSVFALIRLIPGDPAALMLGDMADPASLSDLQERLGLNHSLPGRSGSIDYIEPAGSASHPRPLLDQRQNRVGRRPVCDTGRRASRDGRSLAAEQRA
jgi:hypothetical protein